MLKMLKPVFDSCSDAILCESGGTIIYLNPAAEKRFEGAETGCSVSDLFPSELADGEGEFAFSCNIGGALNVSVRPMDGFRIFVAAQAETEAERRAALCSMLGMKMNNALSRYFDSEEPLMLEVDRWGDKSLTESFASGDREIFILTRLARHISKIPDIDLTDLYENLPRIDLALTVRDACETAQFLLAGTGVKLTFETALQQAIVYGSEELLKTALYELLSNSFKYTAPGGSVSVGISESGGNYRISVTDTGCGLKEGAMYNIFRKFEEPWSFTDTKRGLGVGLAIVRQTALRHGGTAAIANTSGGVRAVITLPKANRGEALLHAPKVPYETRWEPAQANPLIDLAENIPAEHFAPRERC